MRNCVYANDASRRRGYGSAGARHCFVPGFRRARRWLAAGFLTGCIVAFRQAGDCSPHAILNNSLSSRLRNFIYRYVPEASRLFQGFFPCSTTHEAAARRGSWNPIQQPRCRRAPRIVEPDCLRLNTGLQEGLSWSFSHGTFEKTMPRSHSTSVAAATETDDFPVERVPLVVEDHGNPVQSQRLHVSQRVLKPMPMTPVVPWRAPVSTSSQTFPYTS